MEPLATVELNNEWRHLQLEEEKEIERVLQHLSGLVGQFGERIGYDVDALAAIDLAVAKAKYALDLRATAPRLETGYRLNLRQARHPLLERRRGAHRRRPGPGRRAGGAGRGRRARDGTGDRAGRGARRGAGPAGGDAQGLHRPGDHRPQHGGQDGGPQDGGAAAADGPGGDAPPGDGGLLGGRLRPGLRRHRGRAEHRAEPLHLLLAHEQHRAHSGAGGRGLPGAAGRAGGRDGPRGGLGPGPGDPLLPGGRGTCAPSPPPTTRS